MSYVNQTLFNCCTGLCEPDWTQYDALEIMPVYCDPSGFSEPLYDNIHETTFWTVYGHFREGGVEAITDVSTERLAIAAAYAMKRRAALVGVRLSFGEDDPAEEALRP